MTRRMAEAMARPISPSEIRGARERMIRRGVRDPWTWDNANDAVKAVANEVREIRALTEF